MNLQEQAKLQNEVMANNITINRLKHSRRGVEDTTEINKQIKELEETNKKLIPIAFPDIEDLSI